MDLFKKHECKEIIIIIKASQLFMIIDYISIFVKFIKFFLEGSYKYTYFFPGGFENWRIYSAIKDVFGLTL